MLLIPLDKLYVPPDRQRTNIDPDALAELTASIQELGLMNPPTVTVNADGGWRLVAGYRRMLAVKAAHSLGIRLFCGDLTIDDGCIPVVHYASLDELQREELELDENIKRENLSWQERAAAVSRLMALRHRQAAIAGVPAPTIKELAEEAYVPRREEATGASAQQRVGQELLVSRHLDNPEVAKAPTLTDAIKVIKRNEERESNARLAAAVGTTYSVSMHRLIRADCREWMATAPAAQFDCVITDPPYGMGADDFGDSGGRNVEQHSYRDDALAFEGFLANLPDISRLAKPAAHIYVFCDIEGFGLVRDRLAAAGWTPFRTPLVMHKINSGRVPIPDFGPRRCYELVAYAYRGGRKVTGVYNDVFPTNMPEAAYGTGAQKPIEAYVNLLTRSCRPGDRVFDPYCGSGTVFPAATQLSVYATGIEREAATYGVALRRLQELRP